MYKRQGLAGIAHWINTYFGLPEEKKVDKGCSLVHEVKRWVDEEYEGGRVTVLTDEELLKVCLLYTSIRASKEDFKLVKEIGMKETGILVSCSDYHIFMKLKMTRREAMEHYLSVVRDCLEEGISPRCHLEDITRADIYGYVVPFCLELMKLMKQYQIPVKIRACDTMGYGVNYPGAVIPRSVQGIIYALHTHAGVPHEMLEWHGHNDFYKAVVNSSTAWLYGCCGVNTSLFGIGERTGNTPLEAMVFEYAQLLSLIHI